MHKEPGERRVFLPDFVRSVSLFGAEVLLENGYGDELGIPRGEYESAGPRVRYVDQRSTFHADLVVVLRSPERDEFDLLRTGSVLLSMLHFPTRSWRVATLSGRGVGAVAIDQVTDDDGRRLVENLRAVAWNGIETAFDVLESTLPGLRTTTGDPLRVVVLGTGEIGRHAVDAAVKSGSLTRRARLMAEGHPGVVCTSLGRTVTGNRSAMESMLRQCDVLVDATQRADASRPVIPNAWLAWLPTHAVVADLSVDPYLPEDNLPVVRAIEGIPRGNLDKYIFLPDDPGWTMTIPDGIPTANRRRVVSCYSWPGVHPRECMEHYGRQLLPLVRSLVDHGYGGLSLDGDSANRAAYRGSLRAYLGGSTPRDSMSRTNS